MFWLDPPPGHGSSGAISSAQVPAERGEEDPAYPGRAEDAGGRRLPAGRAPRQEKRLGGPRHERQGPRQVLQPAAAEGEGAGEEVDLLPVRNEPW